MDLSSVIWPEKRGTVFHWDSVDETPQGFAESWELSRIAITSVIII